VLSAHNRVNAGIATHFRDTLENRMPFPVRTMQVDGGAEFEAVFEKERQQRRMCHQSYERVQTVDSDNGDVIRFRGYPSATECTPKEAQCSRLSRAI
jgi:hypothetical protein